MAVTFVDLFSGIGGFHAVGRAFGWENVFSSEIDSNASNIYRQNWGRMPSGDITELANDLVMDVPPHNVLFAGFPCQPFSKSGRQQGMDEVRGTLFWNIAKIVETRQPDIVILENVRNLAGPRHIHEWNTIIETIRSLGYKVSSIPLVISPHKIHPSLGGRPQSRERIYICATKLHNKAGAQADEAEQLKPYALMPEWDPNCWDLQRELKKVGRSSSRTRIQKSSDLSQDEISWLNVWDELQQSIGFSDIEKRPGFPIWADTWTGKLVASPDFPDWKNKFIQKNMIFLEQNREEIRSWMNSNKTLQTFPPSRRKFEWQAGNMESVWQGLVQMRPSGIRVKRANYTPAFVAINQTSVYGPERRRLSVREVAYLQGLPAWFDFSTQSESLSYKQLGNGISVAAAYLAIRALAERDSSELAQVNPELLETILSSRMDPTPSLSLRLKDSILH